MATRLYEVATEVISESEDGRPIRIGSSTDTSPTILHRMTIADTIDAVWLTLSNGTNTDVNVLVVINPATTGSSDVADAEERYMIPPFGTIVVLDGHRVRKALTTYTVAAYMELSGDVDKLTAKGHVIRRAYPQQTL